VAKPEGIDVSESGFVRCQRADLPPRPARVQIGFLWDIETTPSGVASPSAYLDFAWDRLETADSLRERLRMSCREEWLRLAAWILREVRVEEIWKFLTLKEVADAFPHHCTPLKRDFLRERLAAMWCAASGFVVGV
jgi:hypothetical protein